MRSFVLAQCAISVLVLLLFQGCGGSGLQKVVVSGDVTYQGQPITNGEIMFYPTKDTQGPVSGASIKDGHYEALGKGGVPVGSHRVVVRAFRTTADNRGLSADAAKSAGMEGGSRQQYLPAKFNDQTTLEMTVDAGQNRAVRDFHLN